MLEPRPFAERIQSQEDEGALELCSFWFLTWAGSSSVTTEKQDGDVIASSGGKSGKSERTAAEQLGGSWQLAAAWSSCSCCAWRGKGAESTMTPSRMSADKSHFHYCGTRSDGISFHIHARTENYGSFCLHFAAGLVFRSERGNKG